MDFARIAKNIILFIVLIAVKAWKVIPVTARGMAVASIVQRNVVDPAAMYA